MGKEHTVCLNNLDFAKALHLVNNRFLLAKVKSFGIDGSVLNWIKAYQVQIDGVPSDEAFCHQGSVIGSLLFLLCVNDLPAALGDSALTDDVEMVLPRIQ